MLVHPLLLTAALTVGAPPAARIAVLLDDPAQGAPATAALERALQEAGYEVVAAEVSARMRQVVAPKEILEARLPEGLSVFEADAVLAGAVSYGEPMDIEGVKSLSVGLSVRLVDLGTGQSAATLQAEGMGVGAGGPGLRLRGAQQAVDILFGSKGLKKALASVGNTAGSVMLVVQGLPDRDALVDLRRGLEKALAGAPVKELYFAKGLGKLVLGGSKSSRSMVGPDVADILADDKTLALAVDEVANTRIVARYDRARTVHVHALVLQPKLPKKQRSQADELGRYLATQLATFDFARASYQPGNLPRKKAVEVAKSVGADVIIESELLGAGDSKALAIRVVDVATGRPIFRQQKVLPSSEPDLGVAQSLVAQLETELPERLSALRPRTVQVREPPTTAQKSDPTEEKMP